MAAVQPPAVPIMSPTATGGDAKYSVLAVMSALEELGVDVGVIDGVGDVIGHLVSCTLDVLRGCGVPPLKVVAVRRALSALPASASTMHDGSDGSDTGSLRVLALLEVMESMGYATPVQELVADLFGLRDVVSLSELRSCVHATALPGRDLIRLRRALMVATSRKNSDTRTDDSVGRITASVTVTEASRVAGSIRAEVEEIVSRWQLCAHDMSVSQESVTRVASALSSAERDASLVVPVCGAVVSLCDRGDVSTDVVTRRCFGSAGSVGVLMSLGDTYIDDSDAHGAVLTLPR